MSTSDNKEQMRAIFAATTEGDYVPLGGDDRGDDLGHPLDAFSKV